MYLQPAWAQKPLSSEVLVEVDRQLLCCGLECARRALGQIHCEKGHTAWVRVMYLGSEGPELDWFSVPFAGHVTSTLPSLASLDWQRAWERDHTIFPQSFLSHVLSTLSPHNS